MENKIEYRLVRRPQTLTPFGVGAIMDIEGESFVAADIVHWKGKGEEIREPRLEEILKVRKFMMAPSAPEYQWDIKPSTPGVPYVRFPNWLFCSKCRRMYYKFSRQEPHICDYCPGEIKLTPMRFVMACPNGHLADVPWTKWAHSNTSGRCESPELYFETEPGGSGLEFVFVRCKKCGARRSLYGIATPDSLKQFGQGCPGIHPWRNQEREACNAIPQVLQRGATNLTFAAVESSIDIPPNSRYEVYSAATLEITNHPFFSSIKTAIEAGNDPAFINMLMERLASNTGNSIATVKRVIERELSTPDQDEEIPEFVDTSGLLAEEFYALSAPMPSYDSRDRFIKRDVDISLFRPAAGRSQYSAAVNLLKKRLDGVVQVTRLREVRVLKGFSRLAPPGTSADEEEDSTGKFSVYGSVDKIPPKLVRADLGKLKRYERWLPGIEVYGEGIFLRFYEPELSMWETNFEVQRRVLDLIPRRNRNATYLPLPNPRLVMLHTLAHILIRELSFECGYSIAAMRERVYAQPGSDETGMAGILIYTAAGDSEGTLGGLVRQGEPDRVLPLILKAIQSADWCSSDPLCRESQGQGMHALNLAACHACSLLPETSCTFSNRLLDRVLLVGSTDRKIPGFFTPILDQLLSIR